MFPQISSGRLRVILEERLNDKGNREVQDLPGKLKKCIYINLLGDNFYARSCPRSVKYMKPKNQIHICQENMLNNKGKGKCISEHTMMGVFVIAQTSTGASRNKMRRYLEILYSMCKLDKYVGSITIQAETDSKCVAKNIQKIN